MLIESFYVEKDFPMNRLKSLALTFSLAVAGVMGLGASTAQAQSLPVNVTATQTQTTTQDLVSNNYVSDDVVAAVSSLPMNNDLVFPHAKMGFTTARVDQTGENVGIQYQLNGSTKTPVAAFNLDDASGQQLFDAAVTDARAKNNPPVVVASRSSYGYIPAPVLPVYYPTYTYVRPVRPIVLFGPVFKPWGHGHHHVIHRPVYRPAPIVINIGGRDRDHHRVAVPRDRGRDHDRGHDRGRDRGGDHRGGPRHR